MLYFKRHIPNFAKILSPIRQLLQKDVSFCWTAEHDQALEKLKRITIANRHTGLSRLPEGICDPR
jgi:hypothetical protein